MQKHRQANLDNILIRNEEPADYFETENLTREAFWNLFVPGCDEHYLLHQLRKSDDFLPELDMVACYKEKIIGNIIYTKAVVREDNITHRVLCMGPLSVLPEFHGRGIGSMLQKVTIEKAKNLGYPAVIIFGHPEYYKRFGYKNAKEYQIQTSKGKNMDAFMVLDLQGKGLTDISGKFFESPAFQIEQSDVEEFDKQFPPKEKGEPKQPIEN